MNNIINLAGAALLIYLYTKKKYNLFFAMVFIELLILPTLKIGNIYINSSYLIGLILFILVVISKSIVIDKLSLTYFSFGLIIILLSSIGWFVNGRPSIRGFISIIGIIKNISIVILISALYNKDYKSNTLQSITNIMDEFIVIFLFINSIAVFMQMFLSRFASKFFYHLYYTPNYTPLLNPYKEGVFKRMYGTFPSPGEFGIVLFTIFAYLFMQHILTSKKEYAFLLGINYFLGQSSLSKSFILGSILIIIISLIMMFKQIIKSRNLRKKLFILFIVFILIYIGSHALFKYRNMPADYYQKVIITDPTKALKSRYSTGDILFKSTYDIIKEHPLIGVGFETVNGEFLGDSSYVVLAHDGGLLALSAFMIMEFLLFKKLKDNKNNTAINILIALTAGSIAATLMYSSDMVIPFLFYITNSKTSKDDNLLILFNNKKFSNPFGKEKI